ncbi:MULTISPECIES: NADP-dependent oxidoreductase [Rhodococcus]|uniref:NADP-dependent oxidoreductase n=1 Tax=Rhodococcus oxybenzonivorans TaxID=1990687 RepID=A0AAE4UZC4_9NOCA|nr:MULTISPECIES: NADP-dependent oxidoreductase [Rhodococcus]MDV7245924.1 NADP-dependent oxidoreductase [Rhodococcus oxybenzonivorans]MDV7265309.1 NADP-dependent oxidoreductase [Rhodococcus oxybenzonivorans]MDV7277272.1 NADP-dependent oxidoreductase [Rhodococcus oxybenzonivorans]MDV7336842.1 NADP-dependent oxidoreductase [Rhodococcus oxybenzonivorans]MDV7346984.1 NADP-dependent oxidoreductase [Rhodococcus oxybenzonivorans]
MTSVNRQVRLAKRPIGLPDDSTWEIVSEPIPTPSDGEFTVQVDYASLDPAMRGWLDDVKSYVPPVQIGEVMRAHAVGRVVASRNPAFPEGAIVSGQFGIQEFAVSDGRGALVVDETLAPAPTWLGALGFPGMTAYFGLTDVGKLEKGDVVLISGAAGAVGSIAGQIAKLNGATVIGIAGGREKCAWLTDELGFDAAIDYKAGPVGRALRAAAPDGIDIYFDNVGGDILDAALGRLRKNARVALCGAISGYNATDPQPGPSRYLSLLVNRASMTGFIVFDYLDRFEEGMEAMSEWIRNGDIVTREQVETGGVEAFGRTLTMLFDGANTGKLVLKISDN